MQCHYLLKELRHPLIIGIQECHILSSCLCYSLIAGCTDPRIRLTEKTYA